MNGCVPIALYFSITAYALLLSLIPCLCENAYSVFHSLCAYKIADALS